MSWSFGVDGGSSGEFNTRAHDAADKWIADHPSEATAEVREQRVPAHPAARLSGAS